MSCSSLVPIRRCFSSSLFLHPALPLRRGQTVPSSSHSLLLRLILSSFPRATLMDLSSWFLESRLLAQRYVLSLGSRHDDVSEICRVLSLSSAPLLLLIVLRSIARLPSLSEGQIWSKYGSYWRQSRILQCIALPSLLKVTAHSSSVTNQLLTQTYLLTSLTFLGPSTLSVFRHSCLSLSICPHGPGRRMIQSLLAHYERMQDIQTVAMITCVVTIPERIAGYDYRKKIVPLSLPRYSRSHSLILSEGIRFSCSSSIEFQYINRHASSLLTP